MRLSLDEARLRVAGGAAWLDAERPGWEAHVDLGTLDVGASCRCVIGQVLGDYYIAARRVPGGVVTCGFAAPHMDIESYPILTAAWRELIEARRATVPASKESAHEALALTV